MYRSNVELFRRRDMTGLMDSCEGTHFVQTGQIRNRYVFVTLKIFPFTKGVN